jgi:hypothetical protein
MASFIDLNILNEPLKNNNDSSLWTPVVGSISSLITNDTTYDDTLMRSLIFSFLLTFLEFSFNNLANSNSAYDIVSYANNIKSTLKRTISCDSDDESIAASVNDLYMSKENIGSGKLQITINYNV